MLDSESKLANGQAHWRTPFSRKRDQIVGAIAFALGFSVIDLLPQLVEGTTAGNMIPVLAIRLACYLPLLITFFVTFKRTNCLATPLSFAGLRATLGRYWFFFVAILVCSVVIESVASFYPPQGAA